MLTNTVLTTNRTNAKFNTSKDPTGAEPVTLATFATAVKTFCCSNVQSSGILADGAGEQLPPPNFGRSENFLVQKF